MAKKSGDDKRLQQVASRKKVCCSNLNDIIIEL